MITSTSVYYNSDPFLATRAVLKIGEFLNNKVFLSRNYRLIVAPRKVGVRKTNICPRCEASRASTLVFPRGNFQTDSSEIKHSVFSITTKFPRAVQKSYLIIFNFFRGKL